MSKNQEDDATSTSKETIEKQHKKFLDSLEKSRIELEGKSVEEIKKLSTLELAKYFCDVHLLIKYYQEYHQTYSDSSITSKELKHKAYIYLEEHTKPDIGKFITVFDTLKARVSQLQEYISSNSGSPFTIWIEPIMESMNNLQNLNPENLENMINNMELVPVIAGFKQLLGNQSLKDPLATWEMIINKGSKDAVANLTEQDKTAIAASEAELGLELALLQASYNIDRFTEEAKALEHCLQSEDVSQVPTTGSSNLGDDDLA
ncbi:hypothetical protein [Candidatus Tisiphia endosymbiont of Dioctria rufipes]|uniref:hypothetical protein n=1 Tax=Candidatus Tisiphia endosymbiont of Dioctria rufipes TaxID=3066255 RepID=UPI00312C7CA4